MDHMCAVIFLSDERSCEKSVPPMMLEPVLFCPILSWVSEKLLGDGIGRFFAVCDPAYGKAVRACFPEEADVTVSEEQSELLRFLEGAEKTVVISSPVLPVEDTADSQSFAMAASTLKQLLEEGHNPHVCEEAEGWFRIRDIMSLQEAESCLRRQIVERHIRGGVRFLDVAAAYIDPRVKIGTGTMILPGTILRGRTVIGRNCTIGPNAMIRDCVIGDSTEINASQTNESVIGSNTHVGPFAYIRPGCVIGDDIKVGDFVEVKNSTLGNGTKISHLTYVGDSDVGEKVNFGCGTVTTNYDGFKKYRCTIGDNVFLGCNTNLVAPVVVERGAYVAAGSTITQDVPEDALAIARVQQTVKEGWAARNRDKKAKRK